MTNPDANKKPRFKHPNMLLPSHMPSVDEIANTINTHTNANIGQIIIDKALASFLYLTGARISEVIKVIRKKDIDIYPDEFKDFGDIIIVRNVPTLKRHTQHTSVKLTGDENNNPKVEKIVKRIHIKYGELERNIPIKLNTDTLKSLWLNVLNYYNTIPNGDDILFPISRINAWKRIKKINDKWWCHYLRHCRLTHLAYNLNAFNLKLLTGWASSSTADSYIHTNISELIKKM